MQVVSESAVRELGRARVVTKRVVYGETGDIEGCKEAYRRALDLDADYATAVFNLGGILWNSSAKHEAIDVWTEALSRFPDDPLAKRLREEFSPLFDDDELD